MWSAYWLYPHHRLNGISLTNQSLAEQSACSITHRWIIVLPITVISRSVQFIPPCHCELDTPHFFSSSQTGCTADPHKRLMENSSDSLEVTWDSWILTESFTSSSRPQKRAAARLSSQSLSWELSGWNRKRKYSNLWSLMVKVLWRMACYIGVNCKSSQRWGILSVLSVYIPPHHL